jgi:hypothetical protein
VRLRKFFDWIFSLLTSDKRLKHRNTGFSRASPIPGFWDIGPHEPIPVEETFQQFVRQTGGEVIADLVSKSPSFKNADFLYRSENVVLELKEVETEFTGTESFANGFERLLNRLIAENPDWRPSLLGGSGTYPSWFMTEYIRLSRPPISRILKKANKQLRETKDYFGIERSSGILLFVNDGFTGIDPYLVQAMASDLLVNDYSSIDCFLYLTVNRYVAIKDSDVPRLVWWPIYSNRIDDSLVDFVNDLGRKWFRFLEEKIGPFTLRDGETQDQSIFYGSKSIVIPKESSENS